MFPEILKSIRIELGISQRALAAETKINRSTIRAFERDGGRLAVGQLETLLGHLGYELDAIKVHHVRARKTPIHGNGKPKAVIRLPIRKD